MENASSSMAKRFQLLFVLPKSPYPILAAYFIITFLLSIVYEFCYGLTFPSSLFSISAAIILQAAVLEVIRAISSHLSPVATTRRLAAGLTFVNGIWLVVTLIILLGKGFNVVGASCSILFTAFVSLALGALIFWPVFTEGVLLAVAISLLDITPVAFLFSLLARYSKFSTDTVSLVLGLAFLTAVLFTLTRINNATRRSLPTSSFGFLKDFLDAWINLDGGPLEATLSDFRQRGSVLTYLVEFNTETNKKVGLVIPEVHPGPFAPVGAFDLPGRIYWRLKEKGYDEVLVLHGAVDHSLNLINSEDVENYLTQLTTSPPEGTFSSKVSLPLCRRHGDAVITGIKFGDSLCVFVSVPRGAEDYPSGFREAVRDHCAKIGYRTVIVVDAHNSIGEVPSHALQSEVLEGIKQVASELFTATQFEFSVAFASKQFAFTSTTEADIGAGGIGCLLLKIDGVDYAIVSADSNNSLTGLREQVEAALAARSIQLLEFCTSDSHFNAARIRNKRGYLVLGETTSPVRVIDDVIELSKRASTHMEKASLGFYEWVAQVNLPNPDLLDRMEAALTSAVNATKTGLALIFGLLFLELLTLLVF